MVKNTSTQVSKSLLPLIEQWGGKKESFNNVSFSGLSYDSRKTRPGDIFFCIKGEHFDGNDFIETVCQKGASLIVSEEAKPKSPCENYLCVSDIRHAMAQAANYFYDNPSSKLRVLGITGTNGKTSTTYLVENILLANKNNVGLIGTMGARWSKSGSRQELIDLNHTTPQCIDFYNVLDRMVQNNISHVSMEVSSHALAQQRVGLCNFASACITNITQDHLDFHVTMENYKKAKALLFSSLNTSSHPTRYAILNRDETVFDELLGVLTDSSIQVASYGIETEADFKLVSQIYTGHGTKIVVKTPEGLEEFNLKLVGRFNLYNVLAAIAITSLEGIKMDVIRQGVESFAGVDGRFELVKIDSQKDMPLCIVDYAHTPDGLENVLSVARELVPKGGSLVAVFGCGGDRDTSKRPQMGSIAHKIADRCVVTSDNPRSEDPKLIIADILAGISRMQNVMVEEDREKAIDLAVLEASHNDVIVVAGKGHETYQLVKDKVLDFDDRQKVRESLKKRESNGSQE